MITTSAWLSPDRTGNARAGSAVASHSELADGNAPQFCVISALTKLNRRPDRRVGERLQCREMEVRLGQRLHGRRAAEACHALTPLDPAHLVTELPRDPDVVILALRHVQNVGLLVAERRLAALVVGKEF